MFRNVSFLAPAIAVLALGPLTANVSADDVRTNLQVAPLQARSATAVTHTVQAGRLGFCQPFPACDLFTFVWDFGAGTFTEAGAPISHGSTIDHTYGAAGIHPWAVRISQDPLAITRSLRFATHDENWPPAVEATGSSDYQVTGRALTLHAWARDDSPATGWTWGVDTDGDEDFNDATVGPGGIGWDPAVAADVTFMQDGLHTVKVRMRDGQGASGTTSFDVRTHTANEPPRAGLTISGHEIPATVLAGQIGFWDEGGTDDYTPTDQLVHSWTIDGQLAPDTGAYFTRTFTAGGPHTVVMKVTDGDGLSTTVSGEFTVVDQLPGSGAGPSGFSVFDDPAAATDGLRPLQNIWLEASDSLTGGRPDSQLAWDLDGDGQYDDDYGAATVVSYAADGTYEVGLRAGDPAATPTTVRRALVVGSGGGTVTPPGDNPTTTTAPPSAPGSAVPLAVVPFGRRLLTAGPIVLTDGVPRGTKPLPGRNAPGLNLRRRALILGTLFASRPARIQATATARLGARASAARTVTLGRRTLTLAANTSRVLELKLPASATRRLRTVKRISITTRLTVTESGRKPVTSTRLATLKVVPR